LADGDEQRVEHALESGGRQRLHPRAPQVHAHALEPPEYRLAARQTAQGVAAAVEAAAHRAREIRGSEQEAVHLAAFDARLHVEPVHVVAAHRLEDAAPLRALQRGRRERQAAWTAAWDWRMRVTMSARSMRRPSKVKWNASLRLS